MLGNIFILGDSYSTFEGYISEEYGSYYTKTGPAYIERNPSLKISDNDVCTVEQTWWYSLAKENGKLLMNCSWSGTTICNTGYDNSDNSKISFVARLEKLLKEGYFEKNKVDTFFLFGGTNDSWADAPLGEKIYSNWETADLYKVFPAFSYLINLLVSKFPGAKIYCIINTELKSEIVEFYEGVCKKADVDFIRLCDIEKTEGHPTVKGMRQIKDQILEYIKAK